MPWIKATDTVSGAPQQVNIDRARMLTDTEEGTEVAFTLADIIIVKEPAEVLVAASGCRWAAVRLLAEPGQIVMINVDRANLICSTFEGTSICWNNGDLVTVMETPEEILAGTRKPRVR